MDEHRKNGVTTVVPCADPDRSLRGAWLLDAQIPFESMIPELDLEEPERSRRLASYDQRLGAIWDEHWFDRFQRIAPSVESPAFCPDVTRSAGGAWMLPGTLPIENLIPDLKAQDASRSTADCFQILGGVWVNDHFTEPVMNIRQSAGGGQGMIFYYFDPINTNRERVDTGDKIAGTGVKYTWAWGMTKKQKAAADRLKEENADWEWSQCYAAVGGQ